MNPRKQGDVGVAEAIRYYTRQGFIVSIPNTEATRYDLIVDDGESLKRVQCKTSTVLKESGSFVVSLRTSGGNRSWTGNIHTISGSEVDEVFVWCSDDTLWVLPAHIIAGKACVNLGTMYQEFKVSTTNVSFATTKVTKT